VLFQGDSITDALRDYANGASMGIGYSNVVARWLSARYPGLEMVFINRGINGDRVCDMEARWTQDCIDLTPDLVSILIGINDCLRSYDSGLASPLDGFDARYRRMLDRVKAETKAGIVVMEPFLVPSVEHWDTCRDDLGRRIEILRKISRDYAALYIPLDGLFAAACARREPLFWSEDGVHPTEAGHAFIAQEWIRTVMGESGL